MKKILRSFARALSFHTFLLMISALSCHGSLFQTNSFDEIPLLLQEAGIPISPETFIAFDNDETLVQHILIHPDIRDDEDEKYIFECLASPDLGRTYDYLIPEAATLLSEEDSLKTTEMHKEAINSLYLKIFNDTTFDRFFSLKILEENTLLPLLENIRNQGAQVKICSSLSVSPLKKSFFDDQKEKLNFNVPYFPVRALMTQEQLQEEKSGDYLDASRLGKAQAIFNHLKAQNKPVNAVVLIDNSPQSCRSFVKKMQSLRAENPDIFLDSTQIIAIQYNYFRNKITAKQLATEFNLFNAHINQPLKIEDFIPIPSTGFSFGTPLNDFSVHQDEGDDSSSGFGFNADSLSYESADSQLLEDRLKELEEEKDTPLNKSA